MCFAAGDVRCVVQHVVQRCVLQHVEAIYESRSLVN